ncbi:MAG: hypothetical protein LBH84_06705, partial [Prevotellaceae bacterium]|nr:hypothetical protein [Prevotellaceae bacterium]
MKKILSIVAALGMNIGLTQAQGVNQVALKIFVADEATEAVAGESFIVKVSIDKQNVEGFARFHVDLPKGFEAEQVETEDAGVVFDFRDQRVRFVWANLPEEHVVNIAYR